MQEQRVLVTIFGATGDLASRKLYPALFRLYLKGYLQDHFAVIGTARRDWTHDYYRQIVTESLSSLAKDPAQVAAFVSHFYYQSHNVDHADHYHVLKNLSSQLDQDYQLKGNRIFYLAMAPQFFATISQGIKEHGLLSPDGYNRLIIEKPFGKDLQSAQELNQQLRATFDEDQIYRIDHYLGKEMVQNISAVRFANRIFEVMWHRDYIQQVQITLAEKVSVEERGGYYDQSGALRDMVQNHILQILALIAMEPPTSFNQIRDKKIQVLRELKKLSPQEVARDFVRGQYGPSQDASLPGYRQDPNVADASQMETFVAGKIEIDNDRWRGVPFYIRTGKSMGEKSTVIDVVFKKAESSLFPSQDTSNRISIHITPNEGFCFVIHSKQAGQSYQLQTSHLERLFDDTFALRSPEAYERLLLDCMEGDMTNFTHWEELAASWAYVDIIRQAWDKEAPNFPNYPAGTMGPEASLDLLARSNHKWIQHGSSQD